MNNDQNESLLDIAVRLMKNKKKPKSLKHLTNEVFQAKGITGDKVDQQKAQFQVDFMLSGYFICCGEDKNGLKLWDLKSRQPSTLLDKDGSYLEDLYADDEDVIKNELKDDFDYERKSKTHDDFSDDDDDSDDDNDRDEIEEELELVEFEEDEDEDEVVIEEDEDDVEKEKEDDSDDTEEELE